MAGHDDKQWNHQLNSLAMMQWLLIKIKISVNLNNLLLKALIRTRPLVIQEKKRKSGLDFCFLFFTGRWWVLKFSEYSSKTRSYMYLYRSAGEIWWRSGVLANLCVIFHLVMCPKVGPLNSGRRYIYISSFTFNLLSQRYLKSKCNKFGLIWKLDSSTLRWLKNI